MIIKLDQIERNIIILLQEDGRMSFVEMARRLSVAEATVRRKFNRLVSEGVIRIAAVANPHEIGFNLPVIISVKAEHGKLESVLQQLVDVDDIRFVAVTTGDSDLIIEGYFSSSEQLKDFILTKLSVVEGISSTQSSVVLNVAKQKYDCGVPIES